jgi:D-aspartate ligase
MGRKEQKVAIVIYTHIVGIAVIRALGRMGIPVVAFYYSSNEVGYLSKYVKERVAVPDPRRNEEGFVDRLVELSSRFEGGLLIPTDDYTLITLSKYKERLNPRYVVGAADWDLVKNVVEKAWVYDLAERIGVPSPLTFLPATVDELKEGSKEIGYPCLIKPLEGHRFYDAFKLKMVKVSDEQELIQKYRQVENLGLKVMVQEIIPGEATEGVNYNSYFVAGKPIAEFTGRKIRVDPPFFGSPRVLVSERIPEIVPLGRALLRALGYEGFSCMEFKRDFRDGVYKLMEINCRNNLTGSLAVYCGINFPYIMYRHLVFGEVLLHHDVKFKENVYWIDITKDMMRLVKSRKEEGYSLKEYVKPYLREKVFGILSLRDPIPFLKRCYYIVRLAIEDLRAKARPKNDEETKATQEELVR